MGGRAAHLGVSAVPLVPDAPSTGGGGGVGAGRPRLSVATSIDYRRQETWPDRLTAAAAAALSPPGETGDTLAAF